MKLMNAYSPKFDYGIIKCPPLFSVPFLHNVQHIYKYVARWKEKEISSFVTRLNHILNNN